MLFSISWRNIWRNKVRSLVIIFSIALGIFAGVSATAFMKGLAEQRIQKVIKTELSYIQIHKVGFRQNSDFGGYMPDANKLVKEIRKIPNVTGASERIVVQAMAATAETATGVLVSGVDMENETKVTNINEKLIDGEYLKGIKKNPIVIGKKLAEKLNAKVRSKLVITLQDTANNVVSGLFRVSGIYTTNNNIYDESRVFVKADDIRTLTELPVGAAHEIAINIDDNKNLQTVESTVKKIAYKKLNVIVNAESISKHIEFLTDVADTTFPDKVEKAVKKVAYDETHVVVNDSTFRKLTDQLAGDDEKLASVIEEALKQIASGNEVLNWKSLSPEMSYLTGVMDMYMYIFIIIILLALLFGIINTMLMVVMERTKEIGMLMAIGMNKRRIFSMVVLESVLLSLVGGVVGIIVGALFAKWKSIYPVDLSAWAAGYEQLGYDSYVYLSLEPLMLVNITLMVICTGVIAALYPAYKALKNDPADALRME